MGRGCGGVPNHHKKSSELHVSEIIVGEGMMSKIIYPNFHSVYCISNLAESRRVSQTLTIKYFLNFKDRNMMTRKQQPQSKRQSPIIFQLGKECLDRHKQRERVTIQSVHDSDRNKCITNKFQRTRKKNNEKYADKIDFILYLFIFVA